MHKLGYQSFTCQSSGIICTRPSLSPPFFSVSLLTVAQEATLQPPRKGLYQKLLCKCPVVNRAENVTTFQNKDTKNYANLKNNYLAYYKV